MRAAWRFIGAVIGVTGLLLIADVAVTLVWQEPITALIAQHEQSQLGGELQRLDRLAIGDARAHPAPHPSLGPLARREARQVHTGHALGRIRLPTLHRDYVMVQGTDESSLRKGPGHYPRTALPGEPGTVAVAGHRTTYLAPFRTINELHPGDPITLSMPYGTFTYRVEKTKIVKPNALWITRSVGHPQLVLSACNPLYSATQRIVVFAKLTATSQVLRAEAVEDLAQSGVENR